MSQISYFLSLWIHSAIDLVPMSVCRKARPQSLFSYIYHGVCEWMISHSCHTVHRPSLALTWFPNAITCLLQKWTICLPIHLPTHVRTSQSQANGFNSHTYLSYIPYVCTRYLIQDQALFSAIGFPGLVNLFFSSNPPSGRITLL